MSCPDWRTLTADPGTPVPAAAWAHAEHCDRCRDAALVADPTLIFRRLPAPRVERDEVDSMRAAVAAMRRDHALEASAPLDPRRLRPNRRRRARPSARAALAALAAAALLAVLLPATDLLPPAAETAIAAPETMPDTEAVPEWLVRLVADQPLVEWADGHHVTQLDAPDLSLVVVSVDDLEVPRLDV